MVIDAGKSQVLERARSHRVDEPRTCGLDVDVTVRDLFEEMLELFV